MIGVRLPGGRGDGVVRWGRGPDVVASRDLKQDARSGRRSPQMQGPWGPGSLKGERHHEPPFPEPKEIPRRREDRKKTVVANADAEPSVDVLLRADPIVHYTINSTVNAHQEAK